jgi:hypothetical protein
MTENELLLKFIASLSLADHMGDVAGDIDIVLERIGIKIEWEDWSDLRNELGRMGVTTLYGTTLSRWAYDLKKPDQEKDV